MPGSLSLSLSGDDRAALDGDRGAAVQLAMRILTRTAEAMDAVELIDVTSAHIDGCLYHGRAGLDFARRLADGGARVAIPTTLNVSSLDLLHPELVHLDPEHGGRRPSADGRVRGDGLSPHLDLRAVPAAGAPRPRANTSPGRSRTRSCSRTRCSGPARVATATSSTSAARSPGRAPAAGLHLDGERLARTVFRVGALPGLLLEDEAAYAAIGHLVGRRTGNAVPAIVGLAADDHRGPPEGPRRGGGVLGRRRDVPRGRRDPRGADARGGDRRGGARARRRALGSRTCGRRATSCRPWRSAPPSGA